MFSPASAAASSGAGAGAAGSAVQPGIGEAIKTSVVGTAMNPVQAGIESALPINLDVIGTGATGATGSGGGTAGMGLGGALPDTGGLVTSAADPFGGGPVPPMADSAVPSAGPIPSIPSGPVPGPAQATTSGPVPGPEQAPSFLENLNEGIGSAFDKAKEYGTQFKDSVGDYLTEKAAVPEEGMSDYTRLREVQDYFGNPVHPLAAVAASEMLTPQEKEKYESIIWPDTSWSNYGADGGSGTSWSNW